MTIESGQPDGTPTYSATSSVADVVHDLKDRATHAITAETHKRAEQASTGLHAVADVLTRASQDLTGEHQFFAGLLKKSADGLQSAAGSLETGDLQSGLSSLADLARRQPALFLAGSFAAGFAMARVGKTAIETGAAETAFGEGG